MNPPVGETILEIERSLEAFLNCYRTYVAIATDPDACDFVFGNPHEMPLPEIGDAIARWAAPRSERWFEYKGSVQGARPGLLRTDTVKKAIANGALLAAETDRHPYVVLTSHLPDTGAGAAMLQTALRLGYLTDVVCIYAPADTHRLRLM